MISTPRYRSFLSGMLFTLVLTSGTAWAQSYPGKPIRLLVPFPPGGPTDIVARPLALGLGERLKQQVIIDNRGGAGGGIAAELVAKAPADGYTLLMGTVGTHAINASLYKNLPYDPLKDFTPIALVAAGPVALVVHPSLKIGTLSDFLTYAKAHPATINFGSAGNGSPGHLTGEMFKSATGADIKHVPYKGSAPAMVDLVGGQIQAMFDPLQSVLPQVQAGKIRILGISSSMRSPVVPDVPTFAEAGVNDFAATAWWGVFAPANLPSGIANRLNSEINAVVQSDAFRRQLVPLGLQVMGGSREDFARFEAIEVSKWSKVVRDSGASVD